MGGYVCLVVNVLFFCRDVDGESFGGCEGEFIDGKCFIRWVLFGVCFCGIVEEGGVG